MTTPTMDKMIKVYSDAASIERLRTGRPNEATVRNTINGVRRFIQWMNERRIRLGYEYRDLDDGFPLVSVIKPVLIHQYLADLLKRGFKPVTAMSYLNQLRQLFARWAQPYYEDRGWKIPPFPPFGKRPKAPRYNRPERSQLLRLKDWYETLRNKVSTGAGTELKFESRRRLVGGRELWFAATMMLEFGMRNSDIMRLTRQNFVEYEGRIYLNYVPHKTEHSSGRSVKWPVHPILWEKLNGELPILDDETFDALNRQMRSVGFTGSKGAYELRKICIDHVYQKYGAEMAVSVSGDDIKTIMHYYADPAQPNIGDVRIIDLL